MRRIALTIAAFALLAVPAGAEARQRDRDHDRLPDKWEKRHHLSTRHKSAKGDPDRDHLSNLGEYRAHTDPRDPDTDGDGIPDGREHAGRVVSFDGGVLTIGAAGGGEVRGRVTGNTEIECGSEDRDEGERAGHVHAAEHGDDAGSDGAGDGDRSEHADGGDSGDRGEAGDPGVDGPGDDGQRDRDCGQGDLKAGARVHGAELARVGGGAVWREIELVR